ncbi:MAG: hypothetical protein HYU02_02100 [Thaumarchaeota archaeon]|nr:hypothetical protein [Nitrososphaerota archaeon]
MPRKKNEDEILQVLHGLQKGQQIIVTWIDASESRSIPLQTNVLHNDAVETPKKTIGVFVRVQKGDAYHSPHLIIGIEKTDNTWHINSIPVCLIKNVEVSNLKTPLSTLKQYGDNVFKIVHRRRKSTLRLKCGGIKYL